jgi:hypothetical protein
MFVYDRTNIRERWNLMTWTVSDVIPPLCSSVGKAVKPTENILNDGEYLSRENRHVKKFTEAKNYPGNLRSSHNMG